MEHWLEINGLLKSSHKSEAVYNRPEKQPF